MKPDSPEYGHNKNLLPLVSNGSVEALAASSKESNQVIADTYGRMIAEQPILANKVAQVIKDTARDETESYHMLTAATLVYKLLELEAETTGLNSMMDPNSQP